MIEKFDVLVTPINKTRKLHIYLPDDYYTSDERYPVVYMYDGHNLFEDYSATYGKSWGLSTFLNQYDKKFIIVGIECSHEGNKRLDEYCPYELSHGYFGAVHGYGDIFMDYVVNELKPMIDNTYRTYPFRECTAIGGSSMGGLMALYTVIKFNRYFSKAACLSPAISICKKQLQDEMNKVNISSDTRVYLSYGAKEIRNIDATNSELKKWSEAFLKRKAIVKTYIQVDGEHNEASWEKQNPIYFDFLWK